MDDDSPSDFEERTPHDAGDHLGDERLEFDRDATQAQPGGRGCLLILSLPC